MCSRLVELCKCSVVRGLLLKTAITSYRKVLSETLYRLFADSDPDLNLSHNHVPSTVHGHSTAFINFPWQRLIK